MGKANWKKKVTNFQAVVSMTLFLSVKSELLPSHEAVPIRASIRMDSRQSRQIQRVLNN